MSHRLRVRLLISGASPDSSTKGLYTAKRRLCFFACSVALLAVTVLGQSSNGYALAGAGSLNSKLFSHAAVGGEKVFGKGIGLGGEIGLIAGHDSFAAFSVNGYYHIPNSTIDRKVDLFVTGGYTAASRLFSASNTGNAGVGLTYWFHRHFGLRAEFRDFVGGDGQVPVFRGGIAFR
jgi:hypothetical protein